MSAALGRHRSAVDRLRGQLGLSAVAARAARRRAHGAGTWPAASGGDSPAGLRERSAGVVRSCQSNRLIIVITQIKNLLTESLLRKVNHKINIIQVGDTKT